MLRKTPSPGIQVFVYVRKALHPLCVWSESLDFNAVGRWLIIYIQCPSSAHGDFSSLIRGGGGKMCTLFLLFLSVRRQLSGALSVLHVHVPGVQSCPTLWPSLPLSSPFVNSKIKKQNVWAPECLDVGTKDTNPGCAEFVFIYYHACIIMSISQCS